MNVPRRARPVSSAGLTLEQHELDRDLRLKISAQLPKVEGNGNAPPIDLEVKDGYVVLRGLVRTFREKERLHRYVMGLRGVRALKDLLRVQPVEMLADERVALHVRQALDAHSELTHGTVTVHVLNGTCHLRGHVRSAEERHIAETVASHCRGVKAVVNELTVDPLEEVSDAASSRAVKCALAYCEDFDIEGITVSCADGKVILRGLVPTLMDRSLAEEVTRLQPGVRSVENHIQVSTQTGLRPVAVTVSDNAAQAGPLGHSRRLDRGGLRKGQAKPRT